MAVPAIIAVARPKLSTKESLILLSTVALLPLFLAVYTAVGSLVYIAKSIGLDEDIVTIWRHIIPPPPPPLKHPRPALGPRQRALTILPVQKGKDHQVPLVYLQPQSSFFHRLPPEIRRLVYRAVLLPPDGSELRIAHTAGRLHSFPFAAQSVSGAALLVSTNVLYSPAKLSTNQVDRPIVEIWLTYLSSYSEAINILYTDPVFNINRHSTLAAWQLSILPQRLRAIRSLHLEAVLDSQWVDPFTPSVGFRKWESTLTIVGMMGGLQTLCVTLSHSRSPPGDGSLVRALGCLMYFKVPSFTVRFLWPVEEQKIREKLRGKVPFTMVVGYV